MPISAAVMMRDRSRASEPVQTASTISSTEGEIAILAYRLWQDNGCPVGSDQEDWFRAEAMLRNALVANGQDLAERPSGPCDDNRTGFDILAEFRWEGHWVVWESEWGGARWIWDLATPDAEVSMDV